MTKEAYKGHRPGSNKGNIHQIFDEKGEAAAVKAGEKAGLKPATIRVWMGAWGRKPAAKKTKAAAVPRKVLETSADKAKGKGKAGAKKGTATKAGAAKKKASKAKASKAKAGAGSRSKPAEAAAEAAAAAA